MAFTTKNGQINIVTTKKGKQKGFVTKNGQISTLIPYQPADVVVVADPSAGEISTVIGVTLTNISAVMGVDKE